MREWIVGLVTGGTYGGFSAWIWYTEYGGLSLWLKVALILTLMGYLYLNIWIAEKYIRAAFALQNPSLINTVPKLLLLLHLGIPAIILSLLFPNLLPSLQRSWHACQCLTCRRPRVKP